MWFRKPKPAPAPRSLGKALLAGLAGGLVGSAAKSLSERLLPPRVEGQPAPPALLAERVAADAHVSLTPAETTVATQTIHWGFGTLIGGVYGLATELTPEAASWQGAAFGLTVNRLTHEGLLPGIQLTEPVSEQPAQERLSEWLTHIVYGVTTELVRRAVRKRL